MPRRALPRSVARAVMVITAAIVVLTACATGERPTFDTTPGGTGSTTETDDTLPPPPALADFLARLVRPMSGAETLVYHVRQNAQDVEADITVVRDSNRTAVDVRGVQFRDSGGQKETCLRATGACTPGWDAQRLSDLQITPDFWGPAVYRRLSGPAPSARIDAITTITGRAAGQPVSCIDIPGSTHVDRFCAVESGALAAEDTVEVHIELASYRAVFEESVWDQFPSG